MYCVCYYVNKRVHFHYWSTNLHVDWCAVDLAHACACACAEYEAWNESLFNTSCHATNSLIPLVINKTENSNRVEGGVVITNQEKKKKTFCYVRGNPMAAAHHQNR